MAWLVGDAWVGIGEPAYKLAPRRRLGLDDARPLPMTVSCFIFRREAPYLDVRGSDLYRAWEPAAIDAWVRAYGWAPVHWETLVLPSAVRSHIPGSMFRAVGYRSLGMTTGRSARRPAGHSRGPRVWSESEPKLVFYKGPLARVALEKTTV